MNIVGFAGKARAGKDEAAKVLVRHQDFCRIALADPMKRVAAKLWDFSEEQLWGDELKEKVDERYGITPRHTLQQLGTNVARNIDVNVWVRMMVRDVTRVLKDGHAYRKELGAYGGSAWHDGVAIPDVRFKNEAEAIHREGGHVIWIHRPEAGLKGEAASHASENSLTENDCDTVIHNTSTLDHFHQTVLAVVHRITRGVPRVVVESPLAGNLVRNQRYARLCLVDCIRKNEAPYASHLLLTQVLDDLSTKDRELGMSVGFRWGEAADICAVYEDLGVSGGMLRGIARAEKNRIPVEHRTLPADLMAQLDGEAKDIRPTQGAA